MMGKKNNLLYFMHVVLYIMCDILIAEFWSFNRVCIVTNVL